MTAVLNVAADFSRSPAGRYKTDGPHSGERFREELLFPALQRESKVEVDLSGVLTMGSSFLEEAFGGLVREKGLSARQLHDQLEITSRIKTYVVRAWSYVDAATPKQAAHANPA